MLLSYNFLAVGNVKHRSVSEMNRRITVCQSKKEILKAHSEDYRNTGAVNSCESDWSLQVTLSIQRLEIGYGHPLVN